MGSTGKTARSSALDGLVAVAIALRSQGDAKIIEVLLPQLQRPEKELRVEAMAALARLTDDKTAETIRSRSSGFVRSPGNASACETAALSSRAIISSPPSPLANSSK